MLLLLPKLLLVHQGRHQLLQLQAERQVLRHQFLQQHLLVGLGPLQQAEAWQLPLQGTWRLPSLGLFHLLLEEAA